jgi:hypothetical protein
MLIRPGKLIPVFFLSMLYASLSGQHQWPGSASEALGGSFVCLDGYMCSGQNQAGLGFTENSSISLQHAQPFLLRELGISTLSAQFKTGMGALGVMLSTSGLKGLRQSSLWLACGQQLHPHFSAGVGLHFWNFSIPEHAVYAPGISFALGLQLKITEQWRWGVRIFHPVSWTWTPASSPTETVSMETGFAYAVFRVARLYSELHVKPGTPLVLCGGVEWKLDRQILMRTGIRSEPLAFSWGISLGFRSCIAEFSGMYSTKTGLSPSSTLTYAW